MDWEMGGKVMLNKGKFTKSYMPLIMPQTWDIAPDRATFAPRAAAVAADAASPAALAALDVYTVLSPSIFKAGIFARIKYF